MANHTPVNKTIIINGKVYGRSPTPGNGLLKDFNLYSVDGIPAGIHHTYEEWETTYSDFVLETGMMGVSFDTFGELGNTQIKIGDGVTPWSELQFIGIGDPTPPIPIPPIFFKQIKNLGELGISETKFQTLEQLIQILIRTYWLIKPFDKIVGATPITIPVLDITDNESVITPFIYDGEIEIDVMEIRTDYIKFRAELRSQHYHPYSFLITEDMSLNEDKTLFWRCPLQYIDGSSVLI